MLHPVKHYSSNVTIMLLIAGVELDVAQVTDTDIFLREPVNVEPGDGEILVTVDNEVSRRHVTLPHGFQGEKQALYW
jgi:hypothetical protein